MIQLKDLIGLSHINFLKRNHMDTHFKVNRKIK